MGLIADSKIIFSEVSIVKLKSTVILVLFTALLTQTSFAQIGGGPGTIGYITFNQPAFDQSLTNAVAGNVMGYQYVLIKNGQMVTEGAGGLAEGLADGYLTMTTSTPTNIGSLAKFLSGTAMLHLMVNGAGPGGSWDQGQSLSQKLNRPFTTIVPDVWVTGNKAGIEDITIRELLQHRSGFDTDKSSVTGRGVLDYLKDNDGFYSSQHGTREYANINFVLNGYLLTMYEYPGAKTAYNSVINTYGLNQPNADQYVKGAAGTSMHSIMKTRIWDQMTPAINPNCDAANTLQTTAAYYYSSKNAVFSEGGISSHMDTTGHCGGEGGYYMSMRDLANYMAHFSASNTIVNSEARNLMFNDAMNPNDRLVWGTSTTDTWMADNFNMPNVVWSNGIGDDSLGRGYRAVIIRLPQNYYLVMATNSPDLSAGSLYNAGVNAFKAGMQHNF